MNQITYWKMFSFADSENNIFEMFQDSLLANSRSRSNSVDESCSYWRNVLERNRNKVAKNQ